MKKFISVLVILFFVKEISAQDNYSLDPTSKISVKGTSSLHDWKVTSNKVQASLTAEARAKRKKMSPWLITEGELTVGVSSLKGGKGETMDGKMNRALKHDEYPFIEFQLTQPFECRDEVIIEGQWTIAGKEKEMAISATCLLVDGKINITAQKAIMMSDFGIQPPSAMFGQIVTGDEVVIDLELFFNPYEEIR